MKSSKLILALWLGVNALAQTPPLKQQANPPVAAKPAVKPAPLKHRAKPSSSKTVAATDGKKAPTAIKGRRDPFVSPIVDRVRAVSCSGSGKQCLVIGEISLRGVVHSPSGYIAVVMNGEHTYFLRENDPLADGSVERITRDAIILRERSSDVFGRPFTREITRKLGVPPV